MPLRCYRRRPHDTGAFILPLKQSFIKDARLMPGTRCMLALLAGWAGQGRALELTEATIGAHIGRSIRQVYRYLQDASREGYLRYGYTKNRMGMITGLRVWLTFDLIRSKPVPQCPPVFSGIPARTLAADTNKKHTYTPRIDADLDEKLQRLRRCIEQRPR